MRIETTDPLTILAVETATQDILEFLDPAGEAQLLLSGRRAAALSLTNAREAADPAQPALIAREHWLDAETAQAIADPAQDFARGPIGPLRPLPLFARDAAEASLALARISGLLPAVWILPAADAGTSVSADDLRSRDATPEMNLVARARLPLAETPNAQILAFRAGDDGEEHVALVIGAFGGRPPLVRLHSECLTGDVFGSLKCDCGPQLREALRLIAAENAGILLYLRQEGRGIGLANKLRAYALQDRGLDTVEANLRLGFGDDEREYSRAAAMLRALGVESVRLLTNNPAKVEGLENAGIKVVDRVAHQMPVNPHNADYVAVKRSKSGHLP